MKPELWYLVLGALLIVIALTSSAFKNWPFTTTMSYLFTGVVLGPTVLSFAIIDPLQRTDLLERAAELVVIVSLFTAGLKLRAPLKKGEWKVPVFLASGSMMLTVGMITLVGVFGLGLPWGAAVLLGAVLAPTDPVLASEVQLESSTDRNRFRFNLTGEAGLNDGTAFPFVMLGVGLLGLHELGELGWRWIVVDVLWAIAGGLAIGAALGMVVGRFMLRLHRRHKSGLGREEFLTLGLIGLSYGAALAAHTYGFLAVFAAGLVLRMIERNAADSEPADAGNEENDSHGTEKTDSNPESASTGFTEAMLTFNEQLERIFEVGLVLVIGVMIAPAFLNLADLWFVPVLLFVIRPVAVVLGLAALDVPRRRVALLSWFGIRGIGSLYYLMYGIGYGVDPEISKQLISITLWVIAVSIVLHGISVTPLMRRFQGSNDG